MFREAQEVHGNTFTALVSQDGKETALVARTTESNPFFIEDYNAKVYCASVPGGLLYVRRNGKCHWSGNSMDSIPDEARSVHPSQLGYIDTIRTPESLKAGVDSRLAFSTRKGSDNKVYAKFLTPNGEEIWRSPQEVSDFVIAFPNEMGSGKEHVVAMVNGQTKMVPRESVQLVMPHFENAFSPLANMIPLKGSSKGQRVAMGSRFLTQALPLRDPEAPLVQSGMPGKPNTSFEEHYGQYLGAVRAADKLGRVRAADNDSITVQYEDGETKTYDLYNNFPYARKTFAHSTPLVKEGDPVRPGQLLARSNNTDENGTVALGKNLKVGYISFRGQNYEDAIVVSESAAKKLSSENMYQSGVEFDKSSKKGKNNFVSIFPTKYERRLLDQIDDDGVIKPGTVVKEGDPLILMARQRDVSHRQVHSSHGGSFSDSSVVWDHHNEGVVTDVAKTAKGITVAVKAYAPLVVGDKLANRFGGKGIVAAVVPDGEMPHNEAGEAMEILLNPLGVISRGNPSQIIETILGKVAAKTGKPYKVLDWSEDVQDWTDYAQKEAEKYGIRDTETLIDPVSGRHIKDILTGSQFILKLHHTSESKTQGRGLGSYNAEGMPAKGGGEGGQCFAPRQLIATTDGPVRISKICEKRLNVKVKTYDFEKNEWTYGRVVDWFVRRCNIAALVTVKTSDGRAMHVTKNHEVFRPSGEKVSIGELRTGDYLATAGLVPTKHQWELMYGSMLGDSSVSVSAFTFEHCIQQNAYLRWKYEILSSLGAGIYDRPSRIQPCSIRGEIVRSSASSVVSLCSRHIFEPLAETCCSGIKRKKTVTDAWLEKLSGLSVAVWVLDDGSIANRAKKEGCVNYTGNIATNGFTREEAKKLATWLSRRYEEPCTVNAVGALCLSAALCRQLIKEIARWVPWSVIPASKKFLAESVRTIQENQSVIPIDKDARLGLVPLRIKEIKAYVPEKNVVETNVYDFTVEKTHNYCAGRTLVSNSKRLALMDCNALLSSGATEVLRDAKLIRGQKNQEYWSSFMSGFRPATPKAPQVYEKFINSLKASGINVQRDGSHLNLMALTDKDVDSMAEGRELQNVETVDWKDGMKPIKGGLFDPTLTGSHGGNRWSYIKLHEMMPSPVMEEPIRKLLGLTQKKFEAVLGGQEKLGDTTGPEAIYNALKAINLDQGITQAREDIRSGKKTLRSDAVKRLNYLAAAKKTGVHPSEWMINKLPVLPPMFRPVSIMQGTGGQLVSDVNYLYKEAWDANENLNAIKGQVADTAEERVTLYNAIKGVTGIGDPISPKNQEKKIKGVLQQVFGSSPKYSTVQYKLLGANMDLVGRAVVAPNPDLNMDEVGLPEDRAWAVYTPFVIRRLVMNGVSRVNALQYVKNRDEIARKALLSEIDSRPVVVTRAPVLHRYGEMAFWPKLTKSNVLQVNPTIVGSYGMDFDGDQQIGIVFASIDRTCLNNIDWIVVNDQSNLAEHRMPFSAGLRLPTLDNNDDLYVFNLEDFPHLEQIEETKGQFGRIEWYRVPEGIKVLSHGPDGQLTWTQVSRWSKHHGCPVEIVNLRSGRQIFTDDDPRAVYGVAAGTLELKRFRPAAAVEARVLVPRVVEMPEASRPEPTVTSLATVGYANAASNREFGMFDNISINEDLGYLVGCAAGDGWVPEERKAFVLSGITQPIVDKVDQIIGRLFSDKRPACLRTESKTSYGESQWHTWNSTHLARMLAELIGQKSQYKHLPVWFLKAPREFRLGLFAGIMDTDGSISVSKAKKKPQLMANVTSTSLRLTQEVSLLALSLGIRGRITNSKTPAGNPCWVWSPSNYDIHQWGGRGMVHPNKLAALESAPVEMSGPLARHDVVPVPTAIADLICKAIPKPNKERKTWLPGHGGMYSAFHDAKSSGHITRLAAEKIVEFIPGGKVDHPEWDTWRTVVANTYITWDPVESFEKTGQVEIGYDLTVPGPETFMAADGVILSNTSNYYVPATDEARDEAVAKMMPSRNLFSVRTFKADTYKPSQEYVGGLWAATAQVDNQKSQKTFASVKDAIRAFYNNNVDIDQQVSVLEH
jgi:intein/homing endonuclease